MDKNRIYEIASEIHLIGQGGEKDLVVSFGHVMFLGDAGSHSEVLYQSKKYLIEKSEESNLKPRSL